MVKSMVPSPEIFQKNWAALKEKSPQFLTWWESQPDQKGIELIYTLSGLPDLRIETKDGKKISLYNHDHPLSLIEQDLQDRQFLKEGVTFLFGLGLGYKAAQIIDRMENGHILFIIEDNAAIVHLALSLHDFSEPIKQGKLSFCLPEEDAIRQIISQQSPKLLDGKISLEMENFAPKISSFYPAVYKSCQRFCNSLFLSYNTFVALSDTFVINELKNLPKIAAGCGTEGFCRGDFSRIPAILVATGPSLQKNIHLLKEAKGKALIIAVGQALRVLLAYDIKPDIICSIDFGKPNYLDLEDVIQDATMPLVIDSRVYPEIPFEYQGDLITPVCGDDILAEALSEHQERVDRGKTVAQLGLNLALAIGADPIIFTGQDLALGTTSHVFGAIADTKVELQDGKILESNSQGKSVNEAFWVEGIYGGRVLTTKVLMGYLEDFENTIKNFPDRCFIDATEGGALIRGTKVMTLREAIDQYCQKDYDIPNLVEKSLAPLNPDFEKLIADLESVNLLVNKILRINRKLKKPITILKKLLPETEGESFSDSQKKRFEELSQRISHGFEQIARAINSHGIIRSALGRVRHALMQRENKFQAGDSIHRRAKVTLRRYELAYKGFEATIRRIKRVMDDILPALKEYSILSQERQTKDKEQTADTHFRLGMCFKKMGCLRRAIPEFEQAAIWGYKREESLGHLVDIYITLEQFEEAQSCLRELNPDPQEEERIRQRILTKKEKCLMRYLTKAKERSLEGDFVNAIVYARKVLAIDPESDIASQILAKSLDQRQEKIAATQEEIRQFREETERKQELARNLSRARKLVQENAFDQAISIYQEILATHQDHPEAHFGLSRAYRGKKDWQAACRELLWLSERYANKAQVHADLGDVYLSMADYGQSFQAYQRAIEGDKNFAHLYLKMANICIHLGKIEEAITHYESYLNLNPADYHSLVKLGDCYLLLGAREAAKIGYQAALRIQPNYSPAMERINRLSL